MFRSPNSRSMSRSLSLLPSKRVEEPMLSTAATRRNAESRSGVSAPSARHAPFERVDFSNKPKEFGFDLERGVCAIIPQICTQYHPISKSG